MRPHADKYFTFNWKQNRKPLLNFSFSTYPVFVSAFEIVVSKEKDWIQYLQLYSKFFTIAFEVRRIYSFFGSIITQMVSVYIVGIALRKKGPYQGRSGMSSGDAKIVYKESLD